LEPVFRLLARLPLPLNQALGALLGRLAWVLSPRLRHRARDNLLASGLVDSKADVGRMARANAAEIGKSVTELAWALFRPGDAIARVQRLHGWEHVEQLRAGNRPIVFVTPHLGAYDVAGRYLWSRLPILAMYRPHKMGWVDRLLREGRNAGAAPDGTNVAPATLAGVRMVLKHLRRGGCTVVLPDQVPGLGEGEWAEFFGRPAYTMTLAMRLAGRDNVACFLAFARRLPRGRGYALAVRPMPAALPGESPERRLNRGIESLIRECPGQYLWSYNRYKGTPP
jgi:KDO2-lipid IV(A) lauroyltransferase